MSVSYLVNEIYPCLQGEGVNCGKPSLLIRLQICNLRCKWCDTPYTHTNKSDPIDKNDLAKGQNFKRYSIEELIGIIKSFPQKHLILSGGEPTLQNIGLLMRKLGEGYSAEVESNGTRIPHKEIINFLPSDYSLMQWNISPKFSNSGEKVIPAALQHWSQLSKQHPQVYFKFVVRKDYKDQDMSEILNLITEFKIPSDKILLMSEGTSVESQLGNIWLHDECLKYGFQYTPRLHIILFGNKRGV